MADEVKDIKEVSKNKLKLLVSKIKKTFYAGSRSDMREIPPEETDVYKGLQNEITALSELHIMLEHIEFKYWTANKRDGSGNVIRDTSTFESLSEEIDKQTAKLGYYENREVAEDERRYYRYSSAKHSNQEMLQIRVEELMEDPTLEKYPGEKEELLKQLNEFLAQIAEEYKKVETDPRKQTKIRDPWNNFQVVKIRFLPKGFVEKLWAKYQKKEVLNLESIHNDALFILKTKINADKKVIDETERAINEYYKKAEYEKIAEDLEIPTDKISNLSDLIRIISKVVQSTENKTLPKYNFDNFFVKRKSIIVDWLNKNYSKITLGSELSDVNDLKSLKMFLAKLNIMSSKTKVQLPLTEEIFKMVYKEIFELRIPPEKRIDFPDGSVHYLRCWGFAYISPHKEKFESIADHVVMNYKHYFLDILKYGDIIKLDEENRELRTEDIKKNLEVVRNKMHRYVNEIFNLIGSEKISSSELDSGASGRGGYEFDMRMYANRALGYYTGDYKTKHLKNLRQNKIGSQKDTRPHVWCKHSYRIFIFPYYDKEEKRGLFPPTEPRKDTFQKLINKSLIDDIEAYNRAVKQYEKEKKEFYTNKNIVSVIEWQKGFEYQPGWDENGMPLEVEDRGLDGKEFSSKGKAKIIADIYKIDLYKGKKERGKDGEANEIAKTIPKSGTTFKIREIEQEIYKKCTAYLDLSLMKEYIEIEWDNYRDDLRDGRYHTNSMTVYDYTNFIMGKHMPFADAEAKINKGEIDNETLSKIRKYTMKLTKDGEKYWDFQDIRKASNLNPAFDKRALNNEVYKEWKFPGRIFYYTYSMPGNIDSDILPKKYDAHITTRGLSMYIIHKVINGSIYLNDAKRVLNYIRENKTKGFDYGPRNYMHSWERDPTNIDVSNIKV